MSHEERRWMRHLSGELSEADTETLRQVASKDAPLADQLERYEDLWQRLEGPPESSVDTSFAHRVVSAARRAQNPPSWRQAPAWVRLGAAASLLLGVTLGSVAGAQDVRGEPVLDEAFIEDLIFASPDLADGYWNLLDEPHPWSESSEPDATTKTRSRP